MTATHSPAVEPRRPQIARPEHRTPVGVLAGAFWGAYSHHEDPELMLERASRRGPEEEDANAN